MMDSAATTVNLEQESSRQLKIIAGVLTVDYCIFEELLTEARKFSKQVEFKLKLLIQDLIDSKINVEEFCDGLRPLLHVSPQPCFMIFLMKTLPLLKQLLASKHVVIDGIRPPQNVDCNQLTSIRPELKTADIITIGQFLFKNLILDAKMISSEVEFEVQTVIRELLNSVIDYEEFCYILKLLLQIPPKKSFINFFRKNISLLRHSFIAKELVIEGINPPVNNFLLSTHSYQAVEIVKRGRRIFSKFLLLSLEKSDLIEFGVRIRIQELINSKIGVDEFCFRIESLLQIHCQSDLVEEIDKYIPFWRQSLSSNRMKIPGISPPPAIESWITSSPVMSRCGSIEMTSTASVDSDDNCFKRRIICWVCRNYGICMLMIIVHLCVFIYLIYAYVV